MSDDGLANVIKNLNKALLETLPNATLRGMIKAAIFIRREMDNSAPSIPVDLGNLRNSWFVITSRGTIQRGLRPNFKGDTGAEMGGDHTSVMSEKKAAIRSQSPQLIMGFSAFYGVFVHENVGASFRQPKAGGKKASTGAKFFEAHLKANPKKILNIIAMEARIK